MEKYVSFEEYTELTAMFFTDESSDEFASYYNNIKLPGMSGKVVKDFKTWEVRKDDIFVITFPKAGTTWAQEIVSCVMHDGNLEEVNKRHTTFRVLFLEMSLPPQIRALKKIPETHHLAEELPSPRVLKTHMPGRFLPPQVWEKKPKIVYVIRNPKDLIVSFFYFVKRLNPSPKKLVQPFGEFFEEVMAGKVFYGTWWDHYLYFWNKRHEENILILRFEDLKRDLRGNVEKISKFLGKNLPVDALDAITDHCTFANMKSNPMANPDSTMPILDKPKDSKDLSFMRKGKVGDWKAHFTVAQNETLDAFIEEKFRGTGLKFEQ